MLIAAVPGGASTTAQVTPRPSSVSLRMDRIRWYPAPNNQLQRSCGQPDNKQ